MPKTLSQTPVSRICANCRYRGSRPDGAGVCAHPRNIPPVGPLAPDHGCEQFQIGFAAARAMAFPGGMGADALQQDAASRSA